ncbi:MAG: hypothetical protein R6V36_08725 [Psychroflexus sp.]
MGRKKIDIDWNKVDQFLIAGCTGTEIAESLGLKPETLYDRTQVDKNMHWTEYSTIKKITGENLLRSKQFQVAMQGDRGMLIWLGKNRLKQSDDPTKKETIQHSFAELRKAIQDGSLMKMLSQLEEKDSVEEDS